MVDLQCMVSYIKWSRVTKSGDFLTIEHGVSKEYPFLLEIKVKKMSNSIKEKIKFIILIYSKCFSRQNVTMSESGEYRCLAGNVLGETSSSIHLQINKSERARIHWTIFGLILFYAMAEK